MPDRLQVWDKQVLLELGRNHTYDKTKDQFKVSQPADVYDLTLHPGFKTLYTEDATTAFGMDYTPANQSFTFFPHRQTADVSGYRGSTGVRFDSDKTEFDKSINNSEMDDGPINHVYTKKADDAVQLSNDGRTISQLRLAYIQQKSGRMGKMDSNNLKSRQPIQTYTYSKSDNQDMQIIDPALDNSKGGYCVTRYLVPGVTPNGKVNDVTDRPPYFMFGVLPDMERKANGVFPYNYFANLNVTYFSTVEWLIATPSPSYIPLGPGGIDNIEHSKLSGTEKKTPIQRQFDKYKKRCVTGGRYDGNFFGGSNYI
ncbi:hypothetical protein RRG08_007842 [Elysia crispata]|uniref:Uncharacterized protein n=1 Tax=Elysia crispata TaxID=231223 RepID=A0AAE1CNS2_9GAST|nr:hypothetical protein RRG08_007842 [Elysia crispata]